MKKGGWTEPHPVVTEEPHFQSIWGELMMIVYTCSGVRSGPELFQYTEKDATVWKLRRPDSLKYGFSGRGARNENETMLRILTQVRSCTYNTKPIALDTGNGSIHCRVLQASEDLQKQEKAHL